MRYCFFIAVVFVLISCENNLHNPKQATEQDSLANTRFNSYKESFVLRLWQLYPDWATGLGYHKYDSVLFAPTDEFRLKEVAFCDAELDSVSKFNVATLDRSNKTDLYLIKNQLESQRFSVTELKSWQWNPAQYNIGEVFMLLMSNKDASLGERLRLASKKMHNVPAYYEAAQKNIQNPTIEHTDLAIGQISGSVSVFSESLTDSLKRSTLSTDEKIKVENEIKSAVAAINSFVSWLKNDVRPGLTEKNARSFRLGKELYSKKFLFDIQSGFSAEQIYQKALDRKKELHDEMAKLSKQLWTKYFKEKAMPKDDLELIHTMIARLSTDHVKADSFQLAIEKQLPELVNFIKEKKLLFIDPAKPLVVRKEPAYMAGIAGASVSSPGPYDKTGNTYYNVGSLSGWTKERAESYLREYNHYILQILNIHEAIPGHYTQLVYSNQSPSIIKSILGNSAMVEGWAVYTERMMLEEGYQASPEMWLMYCKWHLRSVCNTILDYSVHVLNISKDDALKLLTNEAFQEKAEAEGKWRRASLTQVQLCCYFTGYTEIYSLREEMKKNQGDKFNLKAFHEQFLSYGSSPVKYIRDLMLSEKN